MQHVLILGYTADVGHSILRLAGAFIASAVGLLALPLIIFFVFNRAIEKRRK